MKLAVIITMAGALAARGIWCAEPPAPAPPTRFRVAVSTSTLEGVNGNDARAAIKVWADTFMHAAGLDGMDRQALVWTPEQILQGARNGALDAFSITAPEYPAVAPYIDHTSLITDRGQLEGADQYLLLVHNESGIRSLADLRGRSLIQQKSLRTCLAGIWLETLLAAELRPEPESFFGRTTFAVKPALVVLPVFFRRADAALVTRREFEAMCEMNPQLGRTLRIVATSPGLVSSVLLFHKGCSPVLRERLKTAMLGIHQTVAGQQVLTLWQIRSMALSDASILRSVIELMAAHDRIQPRRGAARD